MQRSLGAERKWGLKKNVTKGKKTGREVWRSTWLHSLLSVLPTQRLSARPSLVPTRQVVNTSLPCECKGGRQVSYGAPCTHQAVNTIASPGV